MEATTHAIEREARRLLCRALDAALELLAVHRSGLDRLARQLLEHETLEANALKTILDAPEGVEAPSLDAAGRALSAPTPSVAGTASLEQPTAK